MLPLHLIVAALFGWLEREQRDVIEFLRCAIRSIMTGSAARFHKDNPTAGKADSAVEARAKAALQGDANDTIYQYEASTDYNPSPMLEKIQAPLFAINSADDEIDPPELGILEREIRRVRRGPLHSDPACRPNIRPTTLRGSGRIIFSSCCTSPSPATDLIRLP